MALDPNILLQGVVPDIGKAASQGFDLGQRIRNAPLLRQQAERKAQLDDQALQEGTEDEGTREAVALYQITGGNPITVENYPQIVTTLRRGGHVVDDDEALPTEENVAIANQFALQGQRHAETFNRGKGASSVGGTESFVDVVGQDENGNDILQNFRNVVVLNNGVLTPQNIPVGPTFKEGTNNPLNTANIDRAGGEAFVKAEQKALGEVSVAPQTAAAAAEQSRQVKMSEFQQATSVNAFKQAAAIDSQLGKVDKAIDALNNGAKSGIVSRNLPSFKPATVQLEEAAKELGIDVINSATFGALSATELKLALDTALPLNLDEDELLPYLQDKKDAMIKLRNEMDRMGAFLSEKGNTVSKWRELQKEENAARGSSQASGGLSPKDRLQQLKQEAGVIDGSSTTTRNRRGR